jgi:KipI family sensor histidine kinase inhibitor
VAKENVAEIPVRYGGEMGPDLGVLAREKGMTEGELIRLHSSTTYTVLAMGFMPGFGYLGGVPEVLRAARLSRPRVRVPAGSVAIGGLYTGVYPFESPGGWNIIGHTSARLFDVGSPSPALLRVGQRVRFRVLA